jgi:hypothetical protein
MTKWVPVEERWVVGGAPTMPTGFIGRLVRLRVPLSEVRTRDGGTDTFAAGAVGVVGHPVGTQIVIAFPKSGIDAIMLAGVPARDRLNRLARIPFTAIEVNHPTLKLQFDIES